MAKVTSKLQVTIPKALAERCRIQPGDDIEWSAAADGIRITPTQAQETALTIAARLALFDASTQRQVKRQRGKTKQVADRGRGWSRQDLYTRGRTR